MATGHQQVLADMAPQDYGELRRWARSWIAKHPVPGVDPDDVALAMTELVSNSIKYGSGPVSVDLTTGAHLLRLDVGDSSEDMPRQPPPGTASAGGRGLLLLAGLTSSWGVRLRSHGGKTVWCVFHGATLPATSPAVFTDAVAV